ncbi:hypothetical protein [Streptomyces spiramenti]|uniref:Uncharacterized protein n=1 Tax=Streptomyces spiramenti TaxID=2720606 RepID=A0ABX1AFB9_9ACTN|nr:hypothetical protein [Streptomyces spiramenti]NJP65887.1 hypothetical protein [Streptomyces spiramenti]
MNVFGIHEQLIDAYDRFIRSATVIRDAKVGNFLEDDLKKKSQWPGPWLSLNLFLSTTVRLRRV